MRTVSLLQLVSHDRMPAHRPVVVWTLQVDQSQGDLLSKTMDELVSRSVFQSSNPFQLPFKIPGLNLTEVAREVRRRLPEEIDLKKLLERQKPPSPLPLLRFNQMFIDAELIAQAVAAPEAFQLVFEPRTLSTMSSKTSIWIGR